MVNAVMATDMGTHFTKLGSFKSSILGEGFDPTQEDNKKICADWLFHVADISNASKPFEIY